MKARMSSVWSMGWWRLDSVFAYTSVLCVWELLDEAFDVAPGVEETTHAGA